MSWTPSSWRNFPIKQQPTYQDQELLKKVEEELSSYPPLIFAGEARALKEKLARAGRGEAFLLQGGDCAESFSDFNAQNIKNLFKLMLQMNMVLMYTTGKPVVKVGRIAGQFAKPRSSDFEEIDGVKCEPFETLVIDVPEEVSSKAINLVSLRKGDLLVMEPKGDLQHLEFNIPSRGLIGLRNKILTATAGTAIINHRFSEYGPYKGDLSDDINELNRPLKEANEINRTCLTADRSPLIKGRINPLLTKEGGGEVKKRATQRIAPPAELLQVLYTICTEITRRRGMPPRRNYYSSFIIGTEKMYWFLILCNGRETGNINKKVIFIIIIDR